MRQMQRMIAVLLLLLSSATIYASTDTVLISDLKDKLEQYNKCRGFQGLYLHTDKTVYLQNETIWFAAYQLNPVDTTENTLFIVVQRIGEDSMLSVNRYVMQNGISGGYYHLPQSLGAGDYRLLAYTNMQMGYPEKQVFQQTFTIKSDYQRKFSLQKLGTETGKDGTIVKYKLLLEKGESAQGGEASYEVRTGNNPVNKETLTLSSTGEFSVAVPVQYQDSLLLFKILAHYKKDVQPFELPFRLEQKLKIELYPESGHLLVGTTGTVAFEIQPSIGLPKMYSGALLENGAVLQLIQTDSQGRGVFIFRPDAGKTYTIRLDTDKKYEYRFPAVEQQGMTLHIKEDVVADSVTVDISSGSPDNICYLALHNYRELYAFEELAFQGKYTTRIISLKGLDAKGVLTLTLLDKDRNPLAERCIYVKKDKVTVSVSTDKEQYGPRSKVRMKIRLKAPDGSPAKGIFSIGCVSSSRRNNNRVMSLSDFYYAGQFLHSSGQDIGGFDLNNGQEISLMLLTRFWTRYRWTEMLAVRPPDDVHLISRLNIQFFFEGKTLKQRSGYALAIANEWQKRQTDGDGCAELDYTSLYGAPDRKIGVLPLALDKEDEREKRKIKKYTIHTEFGMFDRIAQQAAQRNKVRDMSIVPEDSAYVLKAKNLLEEVKIVSGRNYDKLREFRSKDCTDYVCHCNILNCENHPGGTPPVDGQVYVFRKPYGEELVYRTCLDSMSSKFLSYINATWHAKDFYVTNYEKESVNIQERQSTLFWTHRAVTDDKGEVETEFYTNDLPGRFQIHLEGFTASGPVSGTGGFSVDNP